VNVVLIGYRGTGKSTVARLLAEMLGRRVFTTDAEIVRRVGCPIPEFVAREGWDRFREVEAEVCREAGSLDGWIIDAGGGVVVRPENVEALRATGRVVWLTAHPDTLAARIGHCTQRPSLTGRKSFLEEIEEVLEERRPLYRSAAHLTVDTDNRTPKEVAEEIAELLRELGNGDQGPGSRV
jgi:shikimate kinase